MLSGVILNLLNNAVKYSPAGSEVNLRVTGNEGERDLRSLQSWHTHSTEGTGSSFRTFLPLPSPRASPLPDGD